jgi:hypothetical protein
MAAYVLRMVVRPPVRCLTDRAQLRAAGRGGPPQFNDTTGASYVSPKAALRSRLGPAARRADRLLKRLVSWQTAGAAVLRGAGRG